MRGGKWGPMGQHSSQHQPATRFLPTGSNAGRRGGAVVWESGSLSLPLLCLIIYYVVFSRRCGPALGGRVSGRRTPGQGWIGEGVRGKAVRKANKRIEPSKKWGLCVWGARGCPLVVPSPSRPLL